MNSNNPSSNSCKKKREQEIKGEKVFSEIRTEVDANINVNNILGKGKGNRGKIANKNNDKRKNNPKSVIKTLLSEAT